MSTFPGSPRILKGALVAYQLPALIPKVVWTLIVIFLPILGLILYFFLGREK